MGLRVQEMLTGATAYRFCEPQLVIAACWVNLSAFPPLAGGMNR
jgi:hypothetical protein